MVQRQGLSFVFEIFDQMLFTTVRTDGKAFQVFFMFFTKDVTTLGLISKSNQWILVGITSW